jgi:hypothetical protein
MQNTSIFIYYIKHILKKKLKRYNLINEEINLLKISLKFFQKNYIFLFYKLSYTCLKILLILIKKKNFNFLFEISFYLNYIIKKTNNKKNIKIFLSKKINNKKLFKHLFKFYYYYKNLDLFCYYNYKNLNGFFIKYKNYYINKTFLNKFSNYIKKYF